jgi:hypothetical protein
MLLKRNVSYMNLYSIYLLFFDRKSKIFAITDNSVKVKTSSEVGKRLRVIFFSAETMNLMWISKMATTAEQSFKMGINAENIYIFFLNYILFFICTYYYKYWNSNSCIWILISRWFHTKISLKLKQTCQKCSLNGPPPDF